MRSIYKTLLLVLVAYVFFLPFFLFLREFIPWIIL
jgi:hypothetical protein